MSNLSNLPSNYKQTNSTFSKSNDKDERQPASVKPVKQKFGAFEVDICRIIFLDLIKKKQEIH